MSRLEMLENQLQVYSKVGKRFFFKEKQLIYPSIPPSPPFLSPISFPDQNSPEDELKQKLTKAYEEKHKHETTTKVCLHDAPILHLGQYFLYQER